MLFTLERGFYIKALFNITATNGFSDGKAILHPFAVRHDIQTPILEPLDLVLLVADHNSHLCLAHPGELLLAHHKFLIIRGCFELSLQIFDFLGPRVLDVIVHPDGCNLVDGDKHRLAALPIGGKVPGEIFSHMPQTRFSGHHVVLALQVFRQLCGDISIINFSLCNRFS